MVRKTPKKQKNSSQQVLSREPVDLPAVGVAWLRPLERLGHQFDDFCGYDVIMRIRSNTC